jgi:hypothetical protein
MHQENYWSTSFDDRSDYDPSLGYGHILMGADGLPAVLMWVHVDDLLIYRPSYEKTCEALRLFLDMAVVLKCLETIWSLVAYLTQIFLDPLIWTKDGGEYV